MAGGRPQIHDREQLLKDFIDYIVKTDIPIVSEFAWTQGLHRQQLYEMAELSDAIKMCVTKKEYALESKALREEVNVSMAIFSLKQLGWSDQQKIHHVGGINISSSDADL